MLQQAYNVMSASADPMSKDCGGRDIGRLGWLTPVKVIDAAGLFTPIVVQSTHWQKTLKADQKMVTVLCTTIATELFDGWAQAARRNPSALDVPASLQGQLVLPGPVPFNDQAQKRLDEVHPCSQPPTNNVLYHDALR